MSGKREYQVQIHIVEARDLKGRDANGFSDPICFVTVNDKKQHTAIFKRTTSCIWDHLFFWQLTLDETEFQQGKVNIGVYDANTFARNVLIGSYDLDVAWIYQQKNHEIYRRWIALCDSENNGSEIQGYLKVSAVVLGPGDSPPTHEGGEEDDEEGDDSDISKMVMMAPSIELMDFQLCVRAFKAQHLPKMDTFGLSDPYVLAKFGGSAKIQTDTKKKDLNPVWNQELRIPVKFPNMTDRIEVGIYDWDRDGDDELIANTFFRFTDIKLNEMPPTWINLYGPPRDKSLRDSVAGAMSSKITDMSAYQGRVLIAAVAEHVEADAAHLLMKPISAPQEPATEVYTLRFDLYEGSEFPCGLTEKVEVHVTCGPYSKVSKPLGMNKTQVLWESQLDELEMTWPRDLSQVPDIIINVYILGLATGKSRVGYVQLKASEARGFDKPPKWVMIKGDVTSSAFEPDRVPGFLLFGMGFGHKRDAPAARPALVKSERVPYQLRAHIYQGRALPAADESGDSDPYCIISCASASRKTERKDNTCFPQWYQTVTMDVMLPRDLTLAPNIAVQVYDYNQFTSNVQLGRFEVLAASLGKRWPGDPKWYPLYVDDPTVTEGEILASFQLIPASEASRVPLPNIEPPMKDYIFEISLVGLRSLLPFNWRDIQEPYIIFDCAGESVQSEPCSIPSGSNPNMLQILKLPVRLPTNQIYSPTVNCKVFDKRTLGDVQIGTAYISVAPYVPWSSVSPLALLGGEGLPKAVDSIPGASKDAPGFDDGLVLPEDLQGGGMEDIPLEIEDVNEQPGQVVKFTRAYQPARTLPDVKDSDAGGGDEEEEKVVERPQVKNELELSFTKLPFYEYTLYRGSSRPSGGLSKMLSKISKSAANMKRPAGKLKANFRVIEAPKYDEFIIASPPQNLKGMYVPKNYIARVYILRGRSIVPKDSNGYSDPYLVVSTGSKKTEIKNCRDNRIEKTLAPDFCTKQECIELPVSLPGASALTIQVWDYDMIGSDELIGETVVDLENRILNDEWTATALKPKEYRTLWVSSSSNPQGKLEMWVELLTPEEAAKTPPSNIKPPEPEEFEVRAIVWKTEDVVFKDKNMSDIFVRSVPEWVKGESQDTDVHWRSMNGEGLFNWRMKYKVMIPCKTPRLKMQVWDKDILNPNDSIAEAMLNLKGLFRKAYKLRHTDVKSAEAGPVMFDMFHPNFEGVQGKLELSLEIMTAAKARAYPAGFGREEPNTNPILEEPARPASSFAPWRVDKLATEFIAANKWRIMMPFIIGAAVFLLVFFVFI